MGKQKGQEVFGRRLAIMGRHGWTGSSKRAPPIEKLSDRFYFELRLTAFPLVGVFDLRISGLAVLVVLDQ
jgi:hypothetical protein